MISPRHILMTADTVGGVWTYAMELSQALTRRGVQVSLATMGAPMSPDQARQSRQAGVEVYESRFKLEWMEDPWADVDAAGEWLQGLEARLRPDLVHLNNFAHGDLPWQAPLVVVGHSCVFSWWNAVHGCAPPSEWKEYGRRVRVGLQAANMIVGVSRAMLRELQHWYGIPSGAVVYNGCKLNEHNHIAHKEDFVLSIGRVWDAAKNIAAVDAAAAQIHWPVYVAGEAQHPEGGRPPLRSVRAIGRLSSEDLLPWFSHASIYALPALYEPFGLSILEAALSGCALVLGDIPSLREIWADAAVYVPPRDHEALTACVNSLIARRSMRDELARRAKTRALSFTTDRMVEGYLSVYTQARARHGATKESSCVS